MARRKLSEKNIRKITRTGGKSLGITIPVEIIRELKWRERQKVVVSKKGKTVVIKDWEPKEKLI